jgi:hypothetical protein
MYVVGSSGDNVYQYSLSTPYSLASGVTYDNISLSFGALETAPTDISFNSTGTALWVIGGINDRIYEFRLGTAWNISTAVFYDDVYVGFNEITVTGLHVIPEQNVAYIVGTNSDTVFQYSTNTPAIEIASSGISSVSSIILNNETRVKDNLYVKGNTHIDGNILAQGTLTVDGTTTLNAATIGSATVTGTLTGNTAVTFDTTTNNINLGTNQTSGNLIVGSTSPTTSTITLGRATTSQTTNIQAGASGVGTTKTINFGTGGASGSFTQINIGPTAGVGTVAINSGTNLGIGSATPTSKLDVVGDAKVSGVVTATTFVGSLTGTATTASSVTLDSVGLGTHTYGDYVQSITPTANQISVSVTSGEGSAPTLSIPNQFTIPQDATVTRDLQVDRNLNVNGNITIGGTSATLFSQSLNISDPDIVLGYRTDAFGNDVSNDSTANHGGVALASTEGTPLVDLFIAGIETNPSTYKKIMWFKSGEFAGLGTDAWLINYAVGIGSTQFPNGTRLAAGSVQFTENDLAVVRNINAPSGIITASSFVGPLTGNAATATYATSAGVATNVIGGIASVTQLYVSSGITTLGVTSATNLTSQQLNVSGVSTSGGVNVTTGNDYKINNTSVLTNDTLGSFVVNSSLTSVGTLGQLNVSGITTLGVTSTSNLTSQQLNVSGITTLGVTSTTNLTSQQLNVSGITTLGIISATDLTSQQLNVSGITTLGVTSTTNLTSQQLNVSGITTLGVTSTTNLTSQQLNVSGISTLGVTSTTNLTSQQLNVSGISTLGVTSTTDLTSQQLNVSGITTLGVTSTTNLTSQQLNVSGITTLGILTVGNIYSTGVITATTFSGNATTASYATNAGIATDVIGGIASVTQLSVSGFSTVGVLTATNIGIGTTNPTVSLWVGGSGYFIGSVSSDNGFYVNGSLIGSGSISGADIVGTALSISGISTLGTVKISSGIITATTGVVTYYGDGRFLQGVVGFAVSLQDPISDPVYPMFANNTGVTTAGISTTQLVFTPSSGNLGLGSTQPGSKLTVQGDVKVSGVVTATTFYGSAAGLTNIPPSPGQINITDTTTNAPYYPTFTVGTGFTDALNITSTKLSFNPSSGSLTVSGGLIGTSLNISGISTFTVGPVLIGSGTSTGTGDQDLQVTGGAYISSNTGIGTTNPSQTLHVQGNARITGAFRDSTDSPGTTNQVLLSTITGTQWGGVPSPSNIPGLKIFDTSIDNVLYVQPTGTLDRVGVGTTVTQITTFPSGSNRYVIHSIHVTNISNGDAEITGGFLLNSRAVPASISVSVGQSGRSGVNTITVGTASSILVGASVNGTGNIGETTGIGSTAGFQYNTYVTSVDGNVISLSKPMSGRAVGVATFTPVSKFASRLPVPVGSAVELLKQPMILNALDSIVLQSTGIGSANSSTSTAAISQTANSNTLTVTVGAAITNFLSSGMLIQGTGTNTGIQTNTFVGVGYTPGSLLIPMTRPATTSVASTSISFTEVVTPQDGALQTTIVYQSSTDTSYLNGTGTVAGISSTTTSITAGLSTVPVPYYSTGLTYPSTVQSIRVSNISDGSIYPGGDYPVWVGIGNSDTIFAWLAYNMVIPKNSSIELCEGPKRLGIGQSIFAYASTPYTIEIQVAGKQKTS